MSEAELGRLKSDLAIMQRAMGLNLPFGQEMLAFGILLSLVALSGAVVSLLGESDWLEVAPFAAIMILGPTGLYLGARRTALNPEITVQVVLSGGVYCIVWGAACGYAVAAFLGPTLGTARTSLVYAINVGLLVTFTLVLVRMALQRRERYYCLGLAVSVLLAGMLLPILDQRYNFPLAHGFMAVGYLTGVAIQWGQLKNAVTHHAAD